MNISKQVSDLGKMEVSFDGIQIIPKEIRGLLSTQWDNPTVLDFFLKSSEICRILFKNPADFEMLEIAYFGKSLRGNIDGFDTWLMSGSSGQALRNRLMKVSALAADWIKTRIDGDMVNVLDFGAGPGPYAIETMKRLTNYDHSLLWTCIDTDRLALAFGEERVRKHGIQSIKFRNANFMSRDSYPTNQNDAAVFGLMVGILCGMTCEEACNCLKKVIPHFRNGGEIMAATLLRKSFEEDPQTFRVLSNVIGWQLRPKTQEEIEEIFKLAGYKVLNVYSERENNDGHYAIVHAKLP